MTTFKALMKLAFCLPVAFLVGCAQWSGAALIASSETPGCDRIRTAIDAVVVRAGVRDVEARLIAGTPYLRVNRFLAYIGQRFRKKISPPEFHAWIMRLRRLDDQAVRIELANLPQAELRDLTQTLFQNRSSRERLADAHASCARGFVAKLLNAPNRQRQLVNAARVADDYSDVAQTVGLFPLTSIPIAEGWKQWKKKHLGSFEQPLADVAVKGRLVEWSPTRLEKPLSARVVRRIIQRSQSPVLGIPEPNGQDAKKLLRTFAPIWQVDVTGNYDRIGYPGWRNQGRSLLVDGRRPVVFSRIGHAVWNGKIVLQLIYTIWFQERPRRGALDLLGGTLDGVIWRVTLSPQGRPVMYDSIHACGCYHFLVPVGEKGFDARPRGIRNLKERPVVLARARVPRPGQRVLLRLATETHYLQNVAMVSRRSSRPRGLAYRLVDENVLRSLPVSPRRRLSLYGSSGIVPGTERLERFVLWTTGVKSPGAIRQWGHHAIAFAERRHFDDPVLFDRVFTKQ